MCVCMHVFIENGHISYILQSWVESLATLSHSFFLLFLPSSFLFYFSSCYSSIFSCYFIITGSTLCSDVFIIVDLVFSNGLHVLESKLCFSGIYMEAVTRVMVVGDVVFGKWLGLDESLVMLVCLPEKHFVEGQCLGFPDLHNCDKYVPEG